jgi:multidrug efflux system membrane fusion protein
MHWFVVELLPSTRFKGRARKALLVLLLWASAVFPACSGDTNEPRKPHPGLPVTVGIVQQKNVPVQLRANGRVEAYSTVSIKSLVAGEILKVHFQEGQDVKKDDPLFTIDPRPYQAAVEQAEANLGRDRAQVKQVEENLERDLAQVNEAEANLARDTAQADNAEKDARRYSYLLSRKDVAQEQYDQVRANADALAATVRASKAAIETTRATVKADKAALENAHAAVRASQAALDNAKIQLSYCFIRSPVDGRTGSLLVQQGNVVKANDTSLVLINQINPVYVSFSLPEKALPEVEKYRALQPLKVEAIIPGDENRREEGVLTFVDNAVDSTTGTIRLKGTFENKKNRLWPGQFVDAILTLTMQSAAVVVPSEAVQSGQRGLYAFVVKPDLTVEYRPVVVSLRTNGETTIAEGLKPGETVVTDGQLRLSPGAKVEIKNDPGRRGEHR